MTITKVNIIDKLKNNSNLVNHINPVLTNNSYYTDMWKNSNKKL